MTTSHSILDRLLGLFDGFGAEVEPPSEALCVALLLLELARADFEFGQAEQDKIRQVLSRRYGLGTEQCEALLRQAQALDQAAVSLFDYVQALNARLAPAGKYELMEILWQVAYADGRLDKHEEHLLRRLAGLLYVSDQDYIRAKLAAEGGAALQ
ncbi:MAG: TerB family tellurite resistance protein [Nevskia sp.]|nr:TerB family tellurite resistance protein [Nevskia sp.]